MRVVFFVLVAVNLVYLAWAGWIDTPVAPPVVVKSTPSLPELAFAAERRSGDQTQSRAQPSAESVPAAQTVAAVTESDSSRATGSASRCVSVGPFNELQRAAGAAALLRDRGFAPKQRAQEGETWNGYWVYIGGLESEAEEKKVVKGLERNGLTDARAMPEAADGRRVSVGLFSEKDRAEKRAQAVKRLGYSADIVERKQPGTEYWVDIELGANDRTVPTEGLLSVDNSNSRLEIRVCPVDAPVAPKAAPLPRDARPAATTADAGVPRPG